MSLSPGSSLSPSSSKSSPSSKRLAGSFSPIGLHVLVVDDDPLCLMVLERMLRQCSYKVTTCNRVRPALQLLRENKDEFDLVISDVYMPDEDGFKLLEVIGLELDLPVIMMSANGETSVVMQGITHGACDYLIKPIRMQELRNIWQHVMRRREREVQKNTMQGEMDEAARGAESQDQSCKKRKELLEMEDSSMDCLGSLKKARVNWSIELHRQFVDAVNKLGVDKAVPKRILEIMNVKGLSRENVASHLQKYRLYLKRLSGVVPEPCPIASFQASDDGTKGGSMKVQPAGKAPLPNAGVKGRNLGAGIGSGVGDKKKIDVGTLESLAKYKLYQQRHAANRAQVLGSLGLADPKFSREPSTGGGLQRMSSLDLSFLLQAQGAGSLMDLSMDPVDDLAACSFRTVKLEDETAGVPEVNNTRTNPSGKSSTRQGHVGQRTNSSHHNDEPQYMHSGAVAGASEYNVGESSGFDAGQSSILGYVDASEGFISDIGQSASGCRGIGDNKVWMGTRIGNAESMATNMENRLPILRNESGGQQPHLQGIQQEQRVGGIYVGVMNAGGASLAAVRSQLTHALSQADLADDAVSSTNVELSSLSTGTEVSGDAFSESSFSALAQLGGMMSPPQPPANSQLMHCPELDISDYFQAGDGFGFQC